MGEPVRLWREVGREGEPFKIGVINIASMYLSILDLILLLILFIFIAFGFITGLIQVIGALLGVVAGAWLAGVYFEPVGSWLAPFLFGNAGLARLAAFILIFTLVTRAIGLAFYFLNKIFNLISIIPFTKSLNRILGALLGALEGTLAIGLILSFVVGHPLSEWFTGMIYQSTLATWLMAMASFLTPLLPEALRQLGGVA